MYTINKLNPFRIETYYFRKKVVEIRFLFSTQMPRLIFLVRIPFYKNMY